MHSYIHLIEIDRQGQGEKERKGNQARGVDGVELENGTDHTLRCHEDIVK